MSPPSNFDSIPLFACPSEPDRRELENHAIEVPIKKGEFIFREGDPADWFHIVKQGNVKCVKSSPEGREVTLKVLMPGDFFAVKRPHWQGKVIPGARNPWEKAPLSKFTER